MLDSLPVEVIEKVVSYLPQRDRVSLVLVCKPLYHKVVPSLYRNLYLNVKPYCHSDLDPTLGSFWSVLYYSHKNEHKADEKFECLVRSLEESPHICSLVRRIHCTWHLKKETLYKLADIITKNGINVTHFENFLQMDIADRISKIGVQLTSLDLPPPKTLPADHIPISYLEKLKKLTDAYNMQNVTSLTIYIDPTYFFPNHHPLKHKLRIKNLCLSLRGDGYKPDAFPLNRLKYSDIFDTEYLEQLSILSWYEDEQVDLYETFHLYELLEFTNIKEFSLLSLFPNDHFLVQCIKKFHALERLKLDYMFDHPISKDVVDIMARSPCAATLQYLDVRLEELDPYIITIYQDEVSYFELNQVCKCEFCKQVFRDIVFKKYFPNQSSLAINSFEDVKSRHVLIQLFRLYPIIPYAQFVDKSPGIAFRARELEAFVIKTNELLNSKFLFYSYEKDENPVTAQNIIDVYHAHLHSMRRTYDFFLQRFHSLKFLTVNEVPTMVMNTTDGQKHNIPVFYNCNYQSNQVYEVVNDESLFD